HRLRAVRGDLDREGLTDPVDGRADARRGRLGEHVQPLRPLVAVRRVTGVRFRPRRREARPGAVLEVRVSTQPVTAPPPVGILRRLFWLLVIVVGLAAVFAVVLGGAMLVETYVV